MRADRDLDALRTEYGLAGTFRDALKRWKETKAHHANATTSSGPVVAKLVERFRAEVEFYLVRHHQADRLVSRAWREARRPRNATKRSIARKRDARERQRDKAWESFERASECLSLLAPWYVHADEELNREYDAIKGALDGIEAALGKLAKLEEELRRGGRVAWYRRHPDGQRGFEPPPNADPRAFIAETRRGLDPVVALLVARDIIQRIPVLANRSGSRGGRPGKPGRNRLVQALADAGVDDATVRSVLLELGYDTAEAGRGNIRSTRSTAKRTRR